ncbi:MAG: hypothetical protein KK482_23060 [Sinorhizobium meliloti]|nr:hypothetical protein [Sinorhizobium meliloti]
MSVMTPCVVVNALLKIFNAFLPLSTARQQIRLDKRLFEIEQKQPLALYQ